MRKAKDAWHASAATGATGQTFEIRTLADFFAVPESRRRICLREFHSFMAIQEGTIALFRAVAESMGEPWPEGAMLMQTDVFRWVDDGLATVTVHLRPMESPGTADAVDPAGEKVTG